MPSPLASLPLATASTTVLAPDLQVGDVIHETGLAGVGGRVAALRIGPIVVDVTLEDGSRRALSSLEVCRVERAPCQHEDDNGPFFFRCRKCGLTEDYAGGN